MLGVLIMLAAAGVADAKITNLHTASAGTS